MTYQQTTSRFARRCGTLAALFVTLISASWLQGCGCQDFGRLACRPKLLVQEAP